MKQILCYGDSNTFGYDPRNGLRYGCDVRWTGVLAGLLGPEYRVIEEGCNGRTTVMDDPEEEWKNGMDYLKPCLNSHKPIDVVILMLGSNDLKRHFALSAEQIAANAGLLVDVIQGFTKEKQGYVPEVILVSPPAVKPGVSEGAFRNSFDPDAVPRSLQFSSYYKIVAEEKGCVFFDAAAFVEASDVDCLHLMPEGHRILAEKLAETIGKLSIYK